jgi:hypothetical protein
MTMLEQFVSTALPVILAVLFGCIWQLYKLVDDLNNRISRLETGRWTSQDASRRPLTVSTH